MIQLILVIIIVLVFMMCMGDQSGGTYGGYSGGSLRLKDESGELLESIKSGKKTIEIRKNSDFVNKDIESGDGSLTFETDSGDITVFITEVNKYKDLATALKSVDVKDIYPNMSKSDAKKVLEQYNSEESVEYWRGEKGDGIIAIHFSTEKESEAKSKTKKATTKK